MTTLANLSIHQIIQPCVLQVAPRRLQEMHVNVHHLLHQTNVQLESTVMITRVIVAVRQDTQSAMMVLVQIS